MTRRLASTLAAALLAAAWAPAAAPAQYGGEDWTYDDASGVGSDDWSGDPGLTDGAEDPAPDEPGLPDLDELAPDAADRAWPVAPSLPTTRLKAVAGRTAMLRTDGRAAVPRGAPVRVRDLIRAANEIVGKPYKWGGGHARLRDKGYDCSGAVSYALVRTGLLRSPLVSGRLAKAYAAGEGRWVTIYATKRHVYMEVAGLRLDTSWFGDLRSSKGVRWRPAVGRRNGFHVRHPVGY